MEQEQEVARKESADGVRLPSMSRLPPPEER